MSHKNTEIIPQDFFDNFLKKNPDADIPLVKKAFEFAKEHHGSQKRASGDPYYHHPVAVSSILADMGLDTATIVTALLHDTVEDTDVTLEDIKKEFGEEISRLVDGVTKLTKIEFQSESARNAENYRKLFLAISEDIRVLLVKLADRLHNMQTLFHIKKPEKRKRIAHETMEIYAPLAERIGMQRLKAELQDIAFAELHPEGYQSIYNRMEFLRNNDKIDISNTVENITNALQSEGISAEISGREKMPYSIWKKMERKNISFEQLSDIIAFRVIVDTIPECYQALGIIHSNYHIVPGSFKDFLSLPKENGYRSLHTIVIGPNHQRIEIQIRTNKMHEINEFGVASHWMYKQKNKDASDGIQYKWLRELITILEDTASTPEEFLEHTKLEMYDDQVFCFTPKGELTVLPKGATPVDFAFALHSDLGKTCVGAKVNGKVVPLRTKLRNGAQVEIITSKSQQPSPIWERFVVTGKARSEIRKFTRSQRKKEYTILGQTIIEKTCENEKVPFNEEILKSLIKHFKKDDVDTLFDLVGRGDITQSAITHALKPEKEKTNKKRLSLLEKIMRRKPTDEKESDKKKTSIPIRGLIPGMAVHFAPCCHPLPGESIVGIMSSGQGVVIHTSDCKELSHFSEEPERWIDVAWEADAQNNANVGRLKAILAHQAGSLGILSNTIAQDSGNINNLRISDRSIDYFEIIVDVDVKDIKHLNTIMASLRAQEAILSVERDTGGIKHE